MDQRIADGVARGRVQFRAGKLTAAVTTWKEALHVAYETQNQSAAFALSKSLGDAVLESSHEDVEGLQEAVGYYEYALQLLDACSLRDEHAFYPPLESVVRYIRRRRRRARRLIRELKAPQVKTHVVALREELSTIASGGDDDVAAASELCSTCETSGSVKNPIIVDEADGCFYCQSCYDAYYAEVNGLQDSMIEDTKERVADEAVMEAKRVYSIEDMRGCNAVSLSETTAGEATERQSSMNEPSNDTEGDQDTIASRPDSGSEAMILQETSGRAACSQTDESLALGEAHVDEEEMEHPELSGFAATKLQYSIADLKSLRRHDLPYPPALKHSPVALTNAAPPSRNQKPPSRKDKPVQRSASSQATLVNQAPQAEVPRSFLPTLAECGALRATMPVLPSPLELAQAFFDTPDSSAASSFATQLQVFSSAA